MSARELVVLGTSSQVPTRYRNHNGYLLRWDATGVLFDPGEGTQRQMIYADVSTSAIHHIAITHFHGDHCLGLAGMSQRISLDRVSHPVRVHYPASGQVYYERLRAASIFHDVATVVANPIAEPGIVHTEDAFTLRVARLSHGVDTFGYRIDEPDSRRMLPDRLAAVGVRGPMVRDLIRDGHIEVHGQRVELADVSVEKKGQSMAFIMDTRVCPGAMELAQGVDMLVCESTFLERDADKAREHGHLTAAQAATIARDAGADLLVLTHFSQRYTDVELFLREAEAVHDNVVAARDCDVIPMPPRRASASRDRASEPEWRARRDSQG